MILFFKTPSQSVIATQVDHQLNQDEVKELCWLYGEATLLDDQTLGGFYVGPRREIVPPWSTNGVDAAALGVRYERHGRFAGYSA